MTRSGLGRLVGLTLMMLVSAGAGPATPSYHGVERAIAKIESDWKEVPVERNPHGPAWAEYFQELRSELKQYATARSADDRFAALNKLHARCARLEAYHWAPARQVGVELRHWLRPRVALAWAEFRLVEALPSTDAELRDKWLAFLDRSLRPAIREVESAGTVAAQLAAIDALHRSIDALGRSRAQKDWSRSRALHEAVASLYNSPNVELSIDSKGVWGLIMPQGVVEPGPVFFRGQWSYVTAGPVLGIQFIPTPDGVHVAVRQALTSVTPIQGFHERIAADARGQRAARMYRFDAATRNDAVLTMVALFRVASGLYLAPNYEHGVSAAIHSTPQPGSAFPRLFASLIGQNQRKITNKVYEGAIGEMRENVVDGSRELSSIRTSESASRLNAQIRPYVLDDRTIGNDRFRLTSMSLETLSTHAVARGVLASNGGPARGAQAGRPRSLASPAAGVTADVHLPSALTNLVAGVYHGEDLKEVSSVMIGPGDASEGAFAMKRDVAFAEYLESIQAARRGGSDAQSVRIVKPEKAPVFSCDVNGNLVVLVNDLAMDVPAPPLAARGGLAGPAAVVYRLQCPQAEVNLGIVYDQATPEGSARLAVRIVGFDPGANFQILAITEDEEKSVPLNAVQARIVLAAMTARAAMQRIELPIDALPLSSFVINSVSKLDPSGWIRVVLMPVSR